jgi:hypothetical protein
MDLRDAAAPFVEAAQSYVQWLHRLISGEGDFGPCRRLLARLSYEAEGLPDVEPSDAYPPAGAPRLGMGDIRHLPFDSYWVVFDPEQEREPVCGSLADDLADIHNDLAEGLELYVNGMLADAVWHWRFSYFAHWGHHALSAAFAVHCHHRNAPT